MTRLRGREVLHISQVIIQTKRRYDKNGRKQLRGKGESKNCFSSRDDLCPTFSATNRSVSTALLSADILHILRISKTSPRARMERNEWDGEKDCIRNRHRSKRIGKRDEFRNKASPETKLVMSAIYCWQQQIRTDLSFIISSLSLYSSIGRVQNNFMSYLRLKFIYILNFLPSSLFTVSSVTLLQNRDISVWIWV